MLVDCWQYVMTIGVSYLLLAGVQRLENSARGKTVAYGAALLPLMLLTAFRYGIGTDYLAKQGAFAINGDEYYELLYHILEIMISKLGGNYRTAVGILTMILFVCILLGMLQTEDKPLAFWIFVFSQTYFFSLNCDRQAIAVAIIALAFVKYDQLFTPKGLLRFTVLLLLAVGFHKSTLIFVLLYGFLWLLTKAPGLMKGIITLPIWGALVFYLARKPLYELAAKLFAGTSYAKFFDQTSQEYFVFFTYSVREIILNLFLYGLILALVWKKPVKEYVQKERILITLQCIITFLEICSPYLTGSHRMLRLFTYFQMFLIPWLLKKVTEKWKIPYWLLTAGVMAFFAYVAVWNCYFCGWEGVVPYQSIWSV